jgi:hypothetical protein
MTVERPAHDVVHQWQMLRDEVVERPLVTVARRGDRGGVDHHLEPCVPPHRHHLAGSRPSPSPHGDRRRPYGKLVY